MGRSTASTPRSSGQRSRALRRAVVDRRPRRPPRAAPRPPRARPRRLRGRAALVAGARSEPIAAIMPGASVLSTAIVPSALKLRVLAAPIARAAALTESDSASATCLCGTVTLAPTKPAPPSALTISTNSSSGAGRCWCSAPAAHAESAHERRVVHLRASGCGRRASRSRPADRRGGPRSRAPGRGAAAVCVARGVVRVDVRLELRVGRRERQLAAGVGLVDVVEVVDVAPARRQRPSPRRRGLRSASAAGPGAGGCCRARRARAVTVGQGLAVVVEDCSAASRRFRAGSRRLEAVVDDRRDERPVAAWDLRLALDHRGDDQHVVARQGVRRRWRERKLSWSKLSLKALQLLAATSSLTLPCEVVEIGVGEEEAPRACGPSVGAP